MPNISCSIIIYIFSCMYIPRRDFTIGNMALLLRLIKPFELNPVSSYYTLIKPLSHPNTWYFQH